MKKEKIVIFSVGVCVCAFLCVMFMGACNIQNSSTPSQFNSDKNSSSFKSSDTVFSDETETDNTAHGENKVSSYDKQVNTSNLTSSKKPSSSISNPSSQNSSKKPAATTSKKPVQSVSSNGSSSKKPTSSSTTTSNDGWTGDYSIPSYPYQ